MCKPFNDSPSKNDDHILVYDESLTKEIPSSSEFEDLHAVYTNLLDDYHPHEQPSIYHAIHSSHYSFGNETLNDILD
jgi:hypothetical protein